MKVKVLVVPTLIVVSGFVVLQYIKPDFDTYMQKRALRDIAQANAEQATATANNVTALKSELEKQKEKVNFVKRYVPADKDQGRIFDGMNFLATQSGLLTSKIDVGVVEEEATVPGETFGVIDPVADADPLTAIDGQAAVPGATPLPVYKAPQVKKYTVSFEALGGYPNMKDALKKLNILDRAQEVQSFRIGVSSDTVIEDADAPAAGTLTLTYNTILPYQAAPAPITGEGIVTIPGLSQGTFDFTKVDTLKAASTAVPDMVLGTEGRSNPFE